MTRIDDLSAFISKNSGVLDEESGAPLVFWDGYGLGHVYSGIAQHAMALSKSLVALGSPPILIGGLAACANFPELDHVLVSDGPVSQAFGGLKFIWPQRVGRLLQKSLGTGKRHAVIHGLSNFNVPLWPNDQRVKRVLTVHDVIPLIEPSGVSWSYHLQFKALLGAALRAADAVICVSDWTRMSLTERYPWVDGKCLVIRNGLKGKSALAQVPSRAGRSVERPHLLFVSRYEAYKNFDLIPEILRLLPKSWQATVVTDQTGSFYLKKIGSEEVNRGRLFVLTGMSHEELGNIYKSCDVYVHPSLYEGFCLPVTEALQFGAGIVFQKGSAIDEIVQPPVGIGLEPSAKAAEWAEACEKMLKSSRSDGWVTSIHKHLGNLPTWDSAARKLRILYNDLG